MGFFSENEICGTKMSNNMSRKWITFCQSLIIYYVLSRKWGMEMGDEMSRNENKPGLIPNMITSLVKIENQNFQ